VSDRVNTGYVPEVLQPYGGNDGDSPAVVRENVVDHGADTTLIEGETLNIGDAQNEVMPTTVMIAVDRESEMKQRPFDVATEGDLDVPSPKIQQDDYREPVALIPAEPVPPPNLEPKPELKMEEEVVVVIPDPEKKPDPKEESEYKGPGSIDDWEKETSKKPPDDSWKDLIEKPLLRGFYYVQIATMGDRGNISKLVNTWRDRYNLVLRPSPLKGSNYSILVGPLTADEYGVVLNRFQGSGFGDAFPKLIQ
jgi:hypothetical protein